MEVLTKFPKISSICERLLRVSRSIRALIRYLSGGRDSQDLSPKASLILCEIVDLLYRIRDQVRWAEEKWIVEQPRLNALNELLCAFESTINTIETYFHPGGVGVRYFRKQLLERTFIPRLELYKTILLVSLQPDSRAKVHTEKQLWNAICHARDMEHGKRFPLDSGSWLSVMLNKFVQQASTPSSEYDDEMRRIAHRICSKSSISLADLSNSKQQETGQWIFDEEKYITWLSGCSRTLYCIGPPGAGKTFLCSSIIGNLQATFTSCDVVVVYVFCHNETDNDQISTTILANILAQLVDRKRSVTHATASLFRSESFANGKASAKAYQNAIRSEIDQFSKVFIVLDGLDMLSEKDRILNRVQRFPEHAQLLVTLREPRHGHKSGYIPILAPREDLETYVAARIEQNPGLKSILDQYPKEYGLEDAFIQQVAGKSHGLFLLARLHMDLLSRCKESAALEKTLLHLPESVTDAYCETMKQIVSHNLHASRCIFWTLYACRPLTVTELKCAAIFEPQNGVAQKELSSIESIILNDAAGLLTVNPMTGAVHLVHNTAKEYLSGAVARVFFPTARKHIAETCITVITSDDVVDDCYINQGTTARNSDGDLVNYAATYWGYHVRQVPEDEQTTQVLIRAFLNKLCWRRPPGQESPNETMMIPKGLGLGKYFADWSALHVLAYFGVLGKAKHLLEKGDDANANDNCLGVTPLHCASYRGNEEMVELLLEFKADINAICKEGNTALHVAAEQGHRKIVKLLLSRRIKSKIMNRQGATALQLAVATANDEATVPLLIRNRADMDVQNETTGNTALHLAIELKRPRILSLLLEKGAALNIANKQGLTPLQMAAKADNCEALALILDHGTRVDARSLFGLTALHIAASEKNWIAFDLLVIGDADINAYNNDGESLLHEQARTASNTSVASHLLERGANIECRTPEGHTPIQYAAMNGNKRMFFFLLEKGAKIDVETSKGQSLLHITPPYNQDCLDILKESLEYGLDVNAASANNWTPLHHSVFTSTDAAEMESDRTLAFIDLLLSNGADINAVSASTVGETPLHLAIMATMPRPSLVLFLIKRGASVNKTTKQGKTPLHLAAERGRDNIFQILLEAGADTSIKAPTWDLTSIHKTDGWETPIDYAKKHPLGILWFDESGNFQLSRKKDQRESIATTIEEVEILDIASEIGDDIGGSTLVGEECSQWVPIVPDHVT